VRASAAWRRLACLSASPLSRLPLLLVLSLSPLLLRRHGVGCVGSPLYSLASPLYSLASPLYSLACLSCVSSLAALLLLLSLQPLLLLVRDRMVVWGSCGGGIGGVAATPCRDGFARGFLWDEGFHQLLVARYPTPEYTTA
jgi:hypothetical protein